jgi:hypothetical protein
MNVYFDTEFIDTGSSIELISIGAIDDQNRTYYAENADCDLFKAGDWVKQNVIPRLTGPRKPTWQIAEELAQFCGSSPQFWTYHGAYDWVLLSQLYGRMLDIPSGWPMFPMDIMNILTFFRISQARLPQHEGVVHNALADAIWTKKCYEWLMNNYYRGQASR